MAPKGGLEDLAGVWVYVGVKHLLQGSRDFGVIEPRFFELFGDIIRDTPNIGQICKYDP
jgi:hypothetical protein